VKKRTPLIAASLVLCAALLSLSPTFRSAPGDTVASVDPLTSGHVVCADGVCIDAELETLASSGAGPSLALFHSFVRTHPTAASLCHRAYHIIGRVRGSLTTHPLSELENGTTSCMYGFEHGLLEGYLDRSKEPSDVTQAIKTVCEGAGELDDVLVRHCAHGAGHALFLMVSDARLAHTYCTTSGLSSVTAIECAHGAFMSWGTSTSVSTSAVAQHEADLVIPYCMKLSASYQLDCVTQGSAALLTAANGSLEAALSRCPSTPETIQAACVSGVVPRAVYAAPATLLEIENTCATLATATLKKACLAPLLRSAQELRLASAITEHRLQEVVENVPDVFQTDTETWLREATDTFGTPV
jgi:hypothetical protein